MKKKNWLISLLLVLAVACGSFALSSCDGKGDEASSSISPTEGVIYHVSDDGTYAEVFGYSGTEEEVYIADVYEGVPVTAVANYAFQNLSSLNCVTIPDSVISIGTAAFYCCTNLTSVTFGDGVNSIGDVAFYCCASLINVTIPSNVASIGAGAFFGCGNLTNVYITDLAAWCTISFGDISANPLTQAENLYLNNTLVAELVIPDSIAVISRLAFCGCDSLTSVTIPSNVASIGAGAFTGCVNLTSVYITDLVTWCTISFSDAAANPLYYAKKLYVNHTLVTQLMIPNEITSIRDWAFFECDSLTSVTIGENVTSIGARAFRRCDNLTSITIGKNVASIGYAAFNECANLKRVILGDGVTWIDDYAFGFCFALTDIYYQGNASDWLKVEILNTNNSNDCLSNVTLYFYSKTQPTSEGNFWHYDANGNPVVW